MTLLLSLSCSHPATPDAPSEATHADAAAAPALSASAHPREKPAPSASARAEPVKDPNDKRTGAVTLAPQGTPDGSYQVSASFFEELGIPPLCTRTRTPPPHDACYVETCAPSSSVTRPKGATVRRPSAGLLDTRFAGKALAPFAPSGKGDLQTYFGGPIVEAPVGGERFEVRTHGDPSGVPAFEGHVTVPKGVRLRKPALTSAFSVDRTKDLTYEWAPGTTGRFTVSLVSAEHGSDGSVTVGCDFDASAKSGVVPAELLGKLRAGTAVHTYGVHDEMIVTARGYTLTVSAQAAELKGARLGNGTVTVR